MRLSKDSVKLNWESQLKWRLVVKLQYLAKTVHSVSNVVITVEEKNWVQESRHKNRGSTYLFAPMVNFNEMAEVGETPP
jgi:hypothetical protein